MKFTKKTGLVLIVVFTMIVSSVNAFDDDETRHIRDTSQDTFVLETGTGYDATFVTVLSPDMDIRAMLFFEDMKPNHWHQIINATLRLRTFHYRAFEADSKFTIYGVRDYYQFGYSHYLIDAPRSPSAILNLPVTSASVVYNSSEFSGPQWHEIDVTVLVREMKNDRHYDGPGSVRANLGDNMIFMIYGPEGYEPRSFYDYRAGNGQEAQLVIHWTSTPSPPSGGVFNETYRGLNIFEIDLIGENRSGINADVNWNLLNMTELSEIDSGAALTLNNDTWLSISALVAQQINSLYNDSGAANINQFFARFAVNISSVTNGGVGDEPVMALCSLSTATPVGGGGLGQGAAGNWVGIYVHLNVDNNRYAIRLINRAGLAFDFDSSSGWFNEASKAIHYIEFSVKDDGAGVHWYQFLLYDDPEFTNLIHAVSDVIDQGRGPWRYAQVSSSLSVGVTQVHTAQFYTFGAMPVANASMWTVAYPNGTQLENSTDYEGAIIFIDNLLGIDPAEPTPAAQDWPDEGPLTRFQTRMFIWFMGYALIFGPLGFFGTRTGHLSGYEFVIGCFLMLVGLGFLIAAGTV